MRACEANVRVRKVSQSVHKGRMYDKKQKKTNKTGGWCERANIDLQPPREKAQSRLSLRHCDGPIASGK